MTLNVIYRLQTFSNTIRRTFVQHFTRFQLTTCSHGSSALAELLVYLAYASGLCRPLMHSSKRWWLWKEPVVMCGKWNVRQATLQQMLKVITLCTDTCFQSLSPLINCVVHHSVLKFSPCHNKTLPQLVHIADWYSSRYAWKNKKDEKFAHFTR